MSEVLALDCRAVEHQFEDFVAVAGVDLSVGQGEVVGLLGPNGAGKTTMIRLINTLLPLRKGSIKVFGLDVRTSPMGVRRLLGYVPQQLSIEGSLTARQNVMLFARLFDVPRRERAARVDEVIELMDLTQDANRQAYGFSGGMIRRLELAQALINRPRLLVLDEPTVGLDPVARDNVWQRVRSMRDEHGTSVLLTTHYMEEADVLCDRISLMHRGSVRAQGTPAELKAAVGPEASLEDVFRHHTAGASLEDVGKEGMGSVRSIRKAARG